MLYVYDDAIKNHMGKFFNNICVISEEDVGKITKEMDKVYENIDPPFLSFVRNAEFDPNDLNNKMLLRSGIRHTNDIKNADDVKHLMFLNVNLSYAINLYADSQQSADDSLSDLLYVLYVYSKIEVPNPFEGNSAFECFYTNIEVKDFSTNNNSAKESGIRYGYTINISVTGAKLYYSKSIKKVLKVDIDFQEKL